MLILGVKQVLKQPNSDYADDFEVPKPELGSAACRHSRREVAEGKLVGGRWEREGLTGSGGWLVSGELVGSTGGGGSYRVKIAQSQGWNKWLDFPSPRPVLCICEAGLTHFRFG